MEVRIYLETLRLSHSAPCSWTQLSKWEKYGKANIHAFISIFEAFLVTLGHNSCHAISEQKTEGENNKKTPTNLGAEIHSLPLIAMHDLERTPGHYVSTQITPFPLFTVSFIVSKDI